MNKLAMPVTAYNTVTACGVGKEALFESLQLETSYLKPLSLFPVDTPVPVGEVRSGLPALSEQLKHFKTRNAQLTLATLDAEGGEVRLAVEKAVKKYGAQRVGVVIGTSTSGMYETELAYDTYFEKGYMPENFDFLNQHSWGATADFLRAELALSGPNYTISTACSSSGKAFASAQRLIASGVCDAVLVGGVDTICQLTFYGFSSLELVSDSPSTPLDANRGGISLGEAGALLLVERASDEHAACPHVLGCGESSDAYHMTAPHPEGEGSQAAMRAALRQAGLQPSDIEYLNLHATGTKLNDASEMKAVESVFEHPILCSGTKGITGHTLGAAGGVEAIISLLALTKDFVPGTQGLQEVDPDFKKEVVQHPKQQKVNTVMSNNFGFGGNNASLIFGWVQ